LTEIEGFLAGGPVFARCSYYIDYQNAPLSDTGVIIDKTYWDVGELEEKGTGTGFSLEGGIRINFNIMKNFALFLEGGYAYQVVNQLSGSGYQTYNYETKTWKGEWAIKEVFISDLWGSGYFQLPSNAWGVETDYKYYKIRDFKLNLSGFRMKIGISYRF
jgi:hypothetical protein